jgi:hypothetical protein
LSHDAHAPFSNQWWFTDEFADGPRRMMDAFWAVPEWAPADESHLLGSASVVTKMAYGAGSVTYSTFDARSMDVLRLDFTPDRVMVGGRPIARRQDLRAEGYTFDEHTQVLRIFHTSSRDVDVQGRGGTVPPKLVTFDDPHEAAGTVLTGQYPSGVVDWSEGTWSIGTPSGKFGTFTLVPKTEKERFRFYAPRIFVGIDVYNGGTKKITLILRSEKQESSSTIAPGELRRVRTGWGVASSGVTVELSSVDGVRFDNLAYLHP